VPPCLWPQSPKRLDLLCLPLDYLVQLLNVAAFDQVAEYLEHPASASVEGFFALEPLFAGSRRAPQSVRRVLYIVHRL